MSTTQQSEPQSFKLPGIDWCELTSIGLKVNHKRASYEEMERTLDHLVIAAKGSPLALGDILSLGDDRHGEKWAQAVDVNRKTGIKIKTLLEHRRVSERVPFSIRMENENVEYTHYKVIADQPQEVRAEWVGLVAEHGWSVAELKQEIKTRSNPAVNTGDNQNYLDPHYKSLLLDYIANQYSYLNRCNYDPWKKKIEKTIRDAKYQLGRTPGSDKEAVKKRVDQLACTVEEIEEEVPIALEEIDRICDILVADHPDTYEFRPIGINTAMARGGRAVGIFNLKKWPPAAEMQRTSSNYEQPSNWN